MQFSFEPFLSLIPVLAVMLGGGVLAGFLAGLLGVGGGAIIVPILYEVFRYGEVEESICMHLVLGTSFAVILPTSVRSAFQHWKKKSIETSLLRRLGPWVCVGAMLGVAIAGYVHANTLISIWVLGSSLMALNMGVGKKDFQLTQSVPDGKSLELGFFFIGMVSALLSIGGGMFFVPLLTLCSVPMLKAVATSSGFGPLIAVPSLIGYMLTGLGVEALPPFSIGYVNFPVAAVILPMSLSAVSWGVNLAHTLSQRRLEILFAIYLLCVSLNFLRKLL